jgi:hypothetical protein
LVAEGFVLGSFGGAVGGGVGVKDGDLLIGAGSGVGLVVFDVVVGAAFVAREAGRGREGGVREMRLQ